MSFLFREALYRPLFTLLIFLYNLLPGHDLGLAIIVMTIAIRLLISPLSIRASRSQQEIAKLTPQINELRARHKDNPAEQSQAIMGLYKEHKVNPFAGCLPILIQLPIII